MRRGKFRAFPEQTVRRFKKNQHTEPSPRIDRVESRSPVFKDQATSLLPKKPGKGDNHGFHQRVKRGSKPTTIMQ